MAEVEPAGTDTVAGTVSTAALLERLMVAPPVRAAFDKVTEHAEMPDAVRVAGEHEAAETVGVATREIEVLAELAL